MVFFFCVTFAFDLNPYNKKIRAISINDQLVQKTAFWNESTGNWWGEGRVEEGFDTEVEGKGCSRRDLTPGCSRVSDFRRRKMTNKLPAFVRELVGWNCASVTFSFRLFIFFSLPTFERKKNVNKLQHQLSFISLFFLAVNFHFFSYWYFPIF